MFGTLKPHRCVLGEAEKLEHRRFYCGLCKSLGDTYGLAYRALLSHDAVFMALVVDGLLVEERAATEGECRCPLMPIQHRPTVVSDSVAMRYAAAIQLLLVDQFLADRAMDGGRTAAMARPLVSRPVEHARALLGELGVSLEELEGFEFEQASCERSGSTTPGEAAEPTAHALGLVFERIASLHGVVEEVRTPEQRELLRRLGRAVGRAIYLVDALEDLEKDLERGDFNPCVDEHEGARLVSKARVRATIDLLDATMKEIGLSLSALPWQRHEGVIAHIVEDQLGRRARRAMRETRAWLAPRSAESIDVARRGAIAAFFAMLIALLTQVSVGWAQDDKPTRRRRRRKVKTIEEAVGKDGVDESGEAGEGKAGGGGKTGGGKAGGDKAGGKAGGDQAEGGGGDGDGSGGLGGEGSGEGGGEGSGEGDGAGGSDCDAPSCDGCVNCKDCQGCGDCKECNCCNDCNRCDCCDKCGNDCGNCKGCCDSCNSCNCK